MRMRYLAMRGYQKLPPRRSMSECASKTWEIAPSRTWTTKPMIALAGQFEKILKFDELTTVKTERTRFFGGEVTDAPLQAYEFKNVMLYRGAIVAWKNSHQVLPYGVEPARLSDVNAVRINEGALSGSYLGLKYFGHWIHDDTPLSLLAEEYGEPISPTPVNMHPNEIKETHFNGYVRLLDLHWRPEDAVIFDKLTMFNDVECTIHRGQRLQVLRERVAKKMGRAKKSKRVFILRGIKDHGIRNFVNEREVAAALEADGFSVVDPLLLSVDEIAEKLYGAEIVVGMEGSHPAHAIPFIDQDGMLLMISPPERYNSPIKRIYDVLDVSYGNIVGDKVSNGFTASIDDIRRTIDLYLSPRAQS